MSDGPTFDNGRDSYVAYLQRTTNAPLALIRAFVKEVSGIRDYEAMRTFVAWRRNPRVSSLVEMAMAIDNDDLDQLLFVAEDHYAVALKQRMLRSPPSDE